MTSATKCYKSKFKKSPDSYSVIPPPSWLGMGENHVITEAHQWAMIVFFLAANTSCTSQAGPSTPPAIGGANHLQPQVL